MKQILAAMGVFLLASSVDQQMQGHPSALQPPPCYGCGSPKAVFGGSFYKAAPTTTEQIYPKGTKTTPRPGEIHSGGTGD